MSNIIPPLKSLQAFEAAARHESFLEASVELCVSSGAISRHIKLLEEYLGIKLFDRKTNGVVLTKKGRLYAANIIKLFSELSTATQTITGSKDRRRLVVSALPIFSDVWLNKRLASFQNRHPKINLQIEMHKGPHDPLNNEIDAWILYSDGHHPGHSVTKLFEEHLTPVLSPQLKQTLQAPINPKQITQMPLLHDIYWSDDWALWTKAMEVSNANLSEGFSFGLYSGVIQAAISGMGVAIGHMSMLAQEISSGSLVALEEMSFKSSYAYYLVIPETHEKFRKTKELRHWLEQESLKQESE